MSGLDYGRLEKLLTMLGSANDGEALNAARLVHKLVSSAGVDWATILGRPRGPSVNGNGAPRAAEEPAARGRQFRIGQRVTHDRFGTGTIFKVKSPWTDRAGRFHQSVLLTIDFDGPGRKRVVDLAVLPLD
jgi:hypothetical protein